MNSCVILENIRSLHNVGSLLRTADGAGWDKIYLCGYTGCPPDRRIEKVSLGAEEFITWEHAESAGEVCKKLKKEGFEILALEQTASAENIFEAKFPAKKRALVLGNEVEGISPEVLALADRHLEIPMHGQKSSLNVSVAGGVAMYRVNEQLSINNEQ
ncbi:RNA methyltransferase [Candidatus Gracilibacteria bacterium]|nr:RNA methyltransferase [Candidatus Gracilibacteria bacterium]